MTKPRTPRNGLEYGVRDRLKELHADFEYENETLPYLSSVVGGCCKECGSKKVGKSRKYLPDFVVFHSDYSKMYIETKGRFPSTDRSKMRDVRRAHPAADIRMVFSSTSKAREIEYGRWCEKNGFPYHFGKDIPEDWIR